MSLNPGFGMNDVTYSRDDQVAIKEESHIEVRRPHKNIRYMSNSIVHGNNTHSPMHFRIGSI